MIRFVHPDYLYALYLIPVLVAVYFITSYKQKRALSLFANEKMHKVLLPFRSKVKPVIKFILVITSIAFLILSLANPQVGSKIEEVKQVGIDVFILLDVSMSMKAEDIRPNRLAKAKLEISKMIQRLRGDRIGLIVFSGEAYVQFPLTTDYSAANLFLNAVDVSSVPVPGTAIEPAINLALNSFKEDTPTKKAIIIITDGEDHEGNLKNAAEEAESKGVQIYAIGLGSAAGSPIPVYNSRGQQVDFKRDNTGNIILTKLDEQTLIELAAAGGGKYYRGTNTENELEQIYNDLSDIEKSEFGTTRITSYEDRFHYFLFPAILFLLAEFFISAKKTKFLIKFDNE